MEIGRLFNHLSREVLAQPSNKETFFLFLRELDNFVHELQNKQKEFVLWATRRKYLKAFTKKL